MFETSDESFIFREPFCIYVFQLFYSFSPVFLCYNVK